MLIPNLLSDMSQDVRFLIIQLYSYFADMKAKWSTNMKMTEFNRKIVNG